MKVVISQPRYLPALNYIQRLHHFDIFVLLDNVQRQGRGIENRNRLIVRGEPRWLTIPISSSSNEMINQTIICGTNWINKHKLTIKHEYGKTPFFDPSYIEKYYNVDPKNLKNFIDYSENLIDNLAEIFGLKVNVIRASKLDIPMNVKGVENIYNICKSLGANVYISGSNGRNYGVKDYLNQKGIEVFYHDFDYPIYCSHTSEQFFPWLGFFDPLFNCGKEKVREMIFKQPILNPD